MKKETRDKLIFGTLFVSILVWSVYSGFRDGKVLDERGVETIGMVTGFGKGGTVNWTYSFGNGKKEILQSSAKYQGLRIGEKFYAKYDPENIKNASIDFSKPFLGGLELDTVDVLEIKHLPIKQSDALILFSYQVNGQTFHRTQRLPKKHDWAKLDSFEVVYNMNNPSFGYIFPKANGE